MEFINNNAKKKNMKYNDNIDCTNENVDNYNNNKTKNLINIIFIVNFKALYL